jgi:hypothetical protein
MVAGRVINLHAGVKRWYDVPLSLAESAEHGRELLIVVGPPHSGVNNCSTIDSLDIYGRRTRMLGLPKAAAAAAAAAAASATLASVAATGAAVTNTASAAGANSASSVVARALSESAAAREATAALRFGATLLREAVRSELPASGALRDELCAVAASALRDVHLGATSAHADVRALLRALLPERSAQAAALDRALFLALAAALDAHGAHSHAAESPTQPDAALVSLLDAAVHVAECRPTHVDALFERAPRFAEQLVAAYDTALGAGVPGRAHVEMLALLLRLLDAYAAYCVRREAAAHADRMAVDDASTSTTTLAALVSSAAPAVDRMLSYLFVSAENVRCAASSVICALARADASTPATTVPAAASSSSDGGGDAKFVCDGCGRDPIGDVRWACDVCANFDLCEPCHTAEISVASHRSLHAMRRLPTTAAPSPMTRKASTASGVRQAVVLALIERMFAAIDRARALGGTVALPFFQTLHYVVLRNAKVPAVRALAPRLLAALLPLDAPTPFAPDCGEGSVARTRALEVRVLGFKMLGALLSRNSPSSSTSASATTATSTTASTTTATSVTTSASASAAQTAARLRQSMTSASVPTRKLTSIISPYATTATSSTTTTTTGTSSTGNKDKSARIVVSNDAQFARQLCEEMLRQRVAASLWRALTQLADVLEERAGPYDAAGDPINVDDSKPFDVTAVPVNDNDDVDNVVAAAGASGAPSNAGTGENLSDDVPAAVVTPSGALLRERGSDVRRSFLPYFTETHVLEHGSDLFANHVHLLTESLLKLAVELRRNVSSGAWARQPDAAALSPTIACRLVHAPRGALFVNGVRYGKKLLLALCDNDRNKYYSLRDSFVVERAIARVAALRVKCAGRYVDMAFADRVALVRLMKQLFDVAAARPRNWLEHCVSTPAHLIALVADLPALIPEAVVSALRLLLYALRGDASPSSVAVLVAAASMPATAPAPLVAGDPSGAKTLVGVLLARAHFLSRFVDTFLLRWQGVCARIAARVLTCSLAVCNRPKCACWRVTCCSQCGWQAATPSAIGCSR